MLLASELNRHSAEDQRKKQQHEREIKPRKHGRVCVRECRKKRPAEDYKPNFIAIPDRADRIEEQPPFFISARERVEDADTEVESVEDGVACQQSTQQHEPDNMQVHAMRLLPATDLSLPT